MVYVSFSCRSHDADLSSLSLRSSDVSVVSLPCGGYYNISSSLQLLASVYQAAGPVLYNVTVTVSHTDVYTGQLVELVATAHSQASLTMPLGKLVITGIQSPSGKC